MMGLVEVDRQNFATLSCCGIQNPQHPGRCEKGCWLEANARFGVRAKVLVTPAGKTAGYIESIPGEYCWRGVDARGYLFIHCLWIHARAYHDAGWGKFMIQDCLAEAAKAGQKGVAVLARKSPWLAESRIFRALGFEVVATAPPDYELLVHKLKAKAANPSFTRRPHMDLSHFGPGLTIVRSGQCPYTAKFAAEIGESALHDYGIQPVVVELASHRDAQHAPTPYAVFSIICDGRILSDHQISRTRFRNIMNQLARSRPKFSPRAPQL